MLACCLSWRKITFGTKLHRVTNLKLLAHYCYSLPAKKKNSLFISDNMVLINEITCRVGPFHIDVNK
jgi:hypothetical protein